MTESIRPGFPLRINSNLYGDPAPAPSPSRHQKGAEPEESEYMLRWGEHDSQVINIFHQLCQVSCNHCKNVHINHIFFSTGKPAD